MNTYLYIKALHLIGIVTWFAGLFYIVRLFIYHVEAGQKPEAEKAILQNQFAIMERRLWYGITNPAMIITTFFGLWLMVEIQAWKMPWFHWKLMFLILLFGYHWSCGKIRKNLLAGTCRLTSKQLRAWNEVTTILLFGIVFTAVLKSPLAGMKGIAGLLVFGTGIFLAMKLFKRKK